MEKRPEEILSEVRGNLGIITVNRPRALNALSFEMLQGIDATLTDFENRDDVRVVLIRGAGEKGLCAGGDIVSLYKLLETENYQEGETYFRAEYTLNFRIATYSKPVVALMDGVVLGGGIGISGHASHRVVTEKTRAGMPETGIGFAPDIGGLKLLAQAPRELGTMLAMTGRHINGADALVVGLADYFVPSDRLAHLTEALENAVDAESVAATISRFTTEPIQSPLAENAFWINTAFAGENAEKIRDALAQQAEEGEEFAAELSAALRRNSPTAIKTALVGIRLAENASLAETLNRDFVLVSNAMHGHDMKEGIRAQVIDKDRNPQWNPATLEEVSEQDVARLFEKSTNLSGLDLQEK
ncbi:enoyl-CoA hydratase/isomerase family protein [uncultured Rothia sp.]|uniref:enoyl-CoA hydratase/isomerase family protein n=1 Tax=uncultured Rothia sp. TaxID=316088 RepID=UPI00321699D7